MAIIISRNCTVTVRIRYLWGQAVDQLFAQEDIAGSSTSVKWMLPDAEGSTRDVVNSSGVVMDHYSYDSFGNATATVGTLSNTRYLYTCQEYDSAIAQYYYDGRWYNPGTGTFDSEDPSGYASDVNPYRYVGNSPTNYTDPLGLCAEGGNGSGTANVLLVCHQEPKAGDLRRIRRRKRIHRQQRRAPSLASAPGLIRPVIR